MDCDRLPTCIFFNDQMEQMPAVAELLKSHFCRGTFAECARFQVATRLGGASVPPDLFPHDRERATRLLEAAK
jgi:hypothetical protein